MRSIGLDLGARHIAFCEVHDGKVIDRTTVESFDQLVTRLGPETAPACVAFEAAREAWHIHDVLMRWGHDPKIVDTTRLKMIGVGQHKRKNDYWKLRLDPFVRIPNCAPLTMRSRAER